MPISRPLFAAAVLFLPFAADVPGAPKFMNAVAGSVPGDTAIRAELPRVKVDITFPQRKSGKTIVVRAQDDLQDALNRAQPGDEVVVQAGAVFTGPFTLPVKTQRNPSAPQFIIVRSSALGNLPEGRRVSPADSVNMPRIITIKNATEAIGTAPGTSGWWLAGLEITNDASVTTLGRLIRLGDGSVAQNTAARVPSFLVVDRSFIHAGVRTDIRRCVDLQSGTSAIINNWISDCHAVGADAQAILAFNGPGPYRIENNYLEGSGENIMFGGSDVAVPPQVPSDIEVRYNYFSKPLSWKKDDPSYAGNPWSIKNVFEVKFGQRILVEGNVFEHAWPQSQVGFALLLKTTSEQKLPSSDITVRSNLIRGAAGGVSMSSNTGPMFRLVIENNQFMDIGTPRWGASNVGRLMFLSSVDDVIITHNSGIAPNAALWMEPPESKRFVFTDNAVTLGSFGIKGSGLMPGTVTLAATAPGATVTRNVFIGNQNAGMYPQGNCVTPSFNDLGIGEGAQQRMVISTYSRFKRCGGERMPGVDHDSLERAIARAMPPASR